MNLDNVYRVQRIVKPGETIAAKEIQTICGGKGLNQSVALARAGMETIHAGSVGDDGQILLDELRNSGVETNLIRKIKGRSGHTIIQVEDSGQNSIVLFGGANQEVSKEYIDDVLQNFGRDDLLLVQNEISNLSYLIERALNKKMRIILNPSPMDDELKKMDFSAISLLILNEIEGEQISGYREPEKILDFFAGQYPGMEVVLTLGEQGAFFQKDGIKTHQNALRVKAVDTTAAGDTFTGFFVKEYYECGNAKAALDTATKAAAIAVTRMGAAPSIPHMREVIQLSE